MNDKTKKQLTKEFMLHKQQVISYLKEHYNAFSDVKNLKVKG